MGVALQDHLIAALRVREQGDLVPHGAGGDEEGGLFAHDRGAAFFERVDGRVLPQHVIPHLGAGHRLAHLGGGLRYGVGSQVDHGSLLRPPASPAGGTRLAIPLGA